MTRNYLMRRIVGPLGLAVLLAPMVASAERKVSGKITDRNGSPVAGVRVEAWDEDSGADDKMKGPTTTDSSGKYELQYRKGKWDSDVWGTSWWRPDIYIRVKIPGGHCEDSVWVDSDWHEIARSSETEDHRVSQDLTKNLKLDDYPSTLVHGEAELGENMYCEAYPVYVGCFACIGGKKVEWSDWTIEGLPTLAHPCASSDEVSECTAEDRTLIKELATNLGDPGYYE